MEAGNNSSKVNMDLLHESCNVDDIAMFFSVSLDTVEEIDAFVYDLQVDKYPTWASLPKERTDAITKILCQRVSFLKSNSGSTRLPIRGERVQRSSMNTEDGAGFQQVPTKGLLSVSNRDVSSPNILSRKVTQVVKPVGMDDVEEVAWSSKSTGNDSTFSTFEGNYINPNAEFSNLKVVEDISNSPSKMVDTVDMTHSESSPIVKLVEIGANTYAGAAGASKSPSVRANVQSMMAENIFEGVNISIPRKVVQNVSTRLQNTLYGYFIGKRIAFPVVEYFAKNNWSKHGLKRIMMNAKGFFFFQFDSSASLDAVLEGGSWMVRNSPIILKKWTMNTRLHK